MAGNSSRQDSHQVAQKLRNTTFPRKSLSELFLPSLFASVKSRATGRFFPPSRLGMVEKLMALPAARPGSGASSDKTIADRTPRKARVAAGHRRRDSVRNAARRVRPKLHITGPVF